MYFFELSHAPPAFDIMSASIIPDAKATASIPARHLGPIINPIIRGDIIAYSPGRIISSTEDWVEIATHLSLSGSAVPSRRPSISANCRLTYDNRASRLLDRQHGECSKEKGKHRSKYYSGHYVCIAKINIIYVSLIFKCRKQRKRS